MNRSEFMKKLAELLVELSPQERQEAIDYYNSYMDDAGVGENDTVPEGIGTPEEVAKELKRSILNPETDFMADEKVNRHTPKMQFDTKLKEKKQKKLSNGELALIIINAVLTSPIWGSLLIAAIGVIVGIGAAVLGMGFGFFVAAGCLVIVGICLIVAGISLLFTETAMGLGLIGAACLSMAIGILFLVIIINCLVVFFPWLIKSVEKLIGKFKKKGGKTL